MITLKDLSNAITGWLSKIYDLINRVKIVNLQLGTGRPADRTEAVAIALPSINGIVVGGTSLNPINTTSTVSGFVTIPGILNSTCDSIDMTYITAGAATGEIASVVFSDSGTVVMTLTLTYDAVTGYLTNVTRT